MVSWAAPVRYACRACNRRTIRAGALGLGELAAEAAGEGYTRTQGRPHTARWPGLGEAPPRSLAPWASTPSCRPGTAPTGSSAGRPADAAPPAGGELRRDGRAAGSSQVFSSKATANTSRLLRSATGSPEDSSLAASGPKMAISSWVLFVLAASAKAKTASSGVANTFWAGFCAARLSCHCQVQQCDRARSEVWWARLDLNQGPRDYRAPGTYVNEKPLRAGPPGLKPPTMCGLQTVTAATDLSRKPVHLPARACTPARSEPLSGRDRPGAGLDPDHTAERLRGWAD